MKKNYYKGLFGLLAFALGLGVPAMAQLDPRYLRNGECYMLIGEGNGHPALRGVYRLNNPERSLYYNPAKTILDNDDIQDTFALSVDLDRTIYTFTENDESPWQDSPDPMFRQVVDGTAAISNGVDVTADHSDYGYWSYFHTDYREWGVGTDIYRVGPANRAIRGTSSFKSAGPGVPKPLPSGYSLPNMTGDDEAKLPIYSGKQWYEIPNRSWYSVWKESGATGSFSTEFWVFGDVEQIKPHFYHLWTWTPTEATANDDVPHYDKDAGSLVAQCNEVKVDRNVRGGCLDGCGGASGNGSAIADVIRSDIAFQPKLKETEARTYFYSRKEGTTENTLTLNLNKYEPTDDNPLIGFRDNETTRWIGISLKNTTSDYVYLLGTDIIREWHNQCSPEPISNMDISAVAVSNQWNQEGGIIYAYDKANNCIYKFERKETEGTPLSSERFLKLTVDEVTSSLNTSLHAEIDDIKADGFGSLYFGISYPSKNPAAYEPRNYFRWSDAIHYHEGTVADGYSNGVMIFSQEYGKVVFERDYVSGEVQEIGRKNFAVRYYNMAVKVPVACSTELKGLSYPNDQWLTIIKRYAETDPEVRIKGIHATEYNITPSSYSEGKAYCDCDELEDLNYADPGLCKLAVINVPTPPKVYSLGDKKSYLDICGPYKNIWPPYDLVNRSTCQDQGLLIGLDHLELDTQYYYMVENYPLPDVAQNPLLQPDWDRDGRQGGFISSIKNPAPVSDPIYVGGVLYEWKTWLVEDLYGNYCCLLVQSNLNGSYANEFYSSVYGKFIMTCRVKYDWYNYDDLVFGSTIADLGDVLNTNAYAWPVPAGSIGLITAAERLAEIKDRPDFAFMNNAADIHGQPVNFDAIIADGDYLAIEPIVCGNGTEDAPEEKYQVASVERCDDYPGVASSSYLFNSEKNFWSNADTGVFGIEAGTCYNWRINAASQSNLLNDISSCNGTDPANSSEYNYVAHMLTDPDSPFYVNGDDSHKFLNNGDDLKWADDDIFIFAQLEYKVPRADGTYEIKKMPLAQNDDLPGTPKTEKASNYSAEHPMFVTTLGDLPPTDPYDAKLVITMRRKFYYNIWSYRDGSLAHGPIPQSNYITVVGEVTVNVIDTSKPSLVYDDTAPNNLFGITGKSLTVGDGPSGMANPMYVNFGFRDNNPWEAIENVPGLTAEEHLTNLAYNYGYEYVENYVNANDGLKGAFTTVKGSISGYTTGIKQQIEAAKSAQPIEPCSALNLKPVFSRAARNVTFSFESSKRISDPKNARYGSMTVGNASDVANVDFKSDDSDYVYHLRERHSPSSVYVADLSFSHTDGHTTVYEANNKYGIAIGNIKLGGTNNYVPDGYANNTPGYVVKDSNGNITDIKPYKFYVSMTDSSGNMTGSKVLNLALHVKDDIPPVGYGIVQEMKGNEVSMFPYKTVAALADPDNAKDKPASYAPGFELDENGNYALLGASQIRNPNWLPSNVSQTGYVNDVVEPGNYQAMMSFGDDITPAFNNDIYSQQIRYGLSPQPAEDNVEVTFSTMVTDNAGVATATLQFKYYSSDGRGSTQEVVTKEVQGGWSSNAQNDESTKIASSSKKLMTIFRGNSDQFPMAIPITITSTDNARDWDYYNGGAVGSDGQWEWNSTTYGAETPRTRVFKTSMPVYGSNVSIRTLDKTVKDRANE